MKESKDNMIVVGADYALQGDSMCITLYKRRVVKNTGLVQWDAIGYFTNIEQAFHRMIDHDVGPINNLQDIAERITEIKKWISDVTQNIAQKSIITRSDG